MHPFELSELTLLVASFSNLVTLGRLERTSKSIFSILTSPIGDRFVYANLILGLKIIPNKKTLFYEQDTTFDEEKFLSKLKEESEGKSFRKMLREFSFFTFVETNYREGNANFKEYRRLGGVADIIVWKPCTLLSVLMKNYYFHFTSSFRAAIHKHLLVLSVNNWDCGRDKNKSVWNYPTSFDVFPSLSILKYSESRKRKTKRRMYAGAVFLGVVDNFSDYKESQHLDQDYGIVIWRGDEFIDYRNIGEPEEDDNSIDIFIQTQDPPYEIKNVSKQIAEMRKDLYYGNCSTYNWHDTVNEYDKMWSSYWKDGSDWWGCYAMTTFNYDDCLFIVATASQTD